MNIKSDYKNRRSRLARRPQTANRGGRQNINTTQTFTNIKTCNSELDAHVTATRAAASSKLYYTHAQRRHAALFQSFSQLYVSPAETFRRWIRSLMRLQGATSNQTCPRKTFNPSCYSIKSWKTWASWHSFLHSLPEILDRRNHRLLPKNYLDFNPSILDICTGYNKGLHAPVSTLLENLHDSTTQRAQAAARFNPSWESTDTGGGFVDLNDNGFAEPNEAKKHK